MNKMKLIALSSSLAVLGLSGCAHKKVDNSMQSKRIAELETKLSQTNNKVTMLSDENRELRNSAASSTSSSSGSNVNMSAMGGGDLYPPNAQPGECYARVLTPAVYTQVTKEVLVKGASEEIEVIPAEYTMVEETILVKEAGDVLKTIPAEYKWVEEQYMVEPEKTELVTIPATYKNVSEQVLVKSAYTTWKKGRGPIEKINDSTGEIMCLVEVPAEYRTVSQRVLDQPAYTQSKTIPAQYNTVKKKVLVREAEVVREVIPAEYKTVMVKKLVKPASERKITIPAEYGSVVENSLVSEADLQWQSILCETNTTPSVINKIQNALNAAGYEAGSVDGVLGSQTMMALKKFQMDNDLASGNITMEALKKLGVY